MKDVPYHLDVLAHAVIGAALEVHRTVGPGFKESAYEAALLVELELLADVHLGQVLSYPKAGPFPLGLLFNFNVPLLRHGIRRIVFSD